MTLQTWLPIISETSY